MYWEHLVFIGGGIGQLGVSYDQTSETHVEEFEWDDISSSPSQYSVSVTHIGGSALINPGSSITYIFIIKNLGELSDTYSIEGTSSLNWVDFSSSFRSVFGSKSREIYQCFG